MKRLWLLGSALATLCLTAPLVAQPNVQLTLLTSGLNQPDFVTHAPNNPSRLFILEQNSGRILIFNRSAAPSGQLLSTPFLDIAARISTGGERGLLGLAFHPQYATNRRFFVHFTDTNGNTVVSQFLRSATDPDLADPSSEQIVLTQTQPFANHNGGMIEFGPDAMLYIGLGDGGGSGDPLNNGQNLSTLLAKILRIDVDHATPYTVHPDNPFAGVPNARGETFAWGFRNPWRFSFDKGFTNRLFAGDVGEGQQEEVDIVTAGGNYGWSIFEGNLCFKPELGCDPAGKIFPISDYDHAEGRCSVTGGYVYRGSAIPELFGKYVFGDLCTGTIWALSEVTPGNWQRTEMARAPFSISSFGEDEQRELYVCAYNFAPDATGGIYRIVSATAASGLTGTLTNVTQVCRGGRPVHCAVRFLLRLTNEGQTRVRSSNVRFYVSQDAVLDTNVDRRVGGFNSGPFRPEQVKPIAATVALPAGVNGSGKFFLAQIIAEGQQSAVVAEPIP